ncbi:MAG: ImmA/IrrE family metallo-endopeptidase [Anaerolineae bacterium]
MARRRWSSEAARALMAITGTDDPVAAMEICANDLLDDAGVAGPPVPLHILASFQGIRSIERVEMESSGRLISGAGGSIVQVNSRESQVRQNFTIAHEIAHTFFPSFLVSPGDFQDDHTGRYPPVDEEEYLCDVGAAALLLPPRWLAPACAELTPSHDNLNRLASRFHASLEATARAVARLDAWAFALVYWEPGWRKADRPTEGQTESVPAVWRVTRVVASPSFALYIPRNKSISEDSTVQRAADAAGVVDGVDRLSLAQGLVPLRAESLAVPARRGDSARSRVVSFFTRV